MSGRDLDGPPRHLTVEPEMPWWQLALCCFVAAIIGFILAVGHS